NPAFKAAAKRHQKTMLKRRILDDDLEGVETQEKIVDIRDKSPEDTLPLDEAAKLLESLVAVPEIPLEKPKKKKAKKTISESDAQKHVEAVIDVIVPRVD